MPEPRDRLVRAEDVAAVYARRRRSVISRFGNGSGGAPITFLDDSPTEAGPTTTPFQMEATPWRGTLGRTGDADASEGGGIEWGSLGTPRIWRGRTPQMFSQMVIGRRNISPATRNSRGRGWGRGILSDWYPRAPLQDITEIVMAIERRRARLREDEGRQLGSPVPREQPVLEATMATSGAHFEHNTSMSTPYPTKRSRPCPLSVGKVPKILLDITNQKDGESAALTPQKKLLNSIDTVEKVVMEELHKMNRTPAAKKAEREKKVRTLMSMR